MNRPEASYTPNLAAIAQSTFE